MDTAPPSDPDPETGAIRLALPALPDYARVVRLAITGLASRNGFSYDQVEDLRIATGELFGALVEPVDPEARLRFTCRLEDDDLLLEATRMPSAPLGEVPALTRQIVAAVVDEFTVDEAAGVLRITKRLGGRP